MFKGVRLYNGVDMPSIGLGTSKLFGNVLTKIVGVAKKNGITMFDTAYNYGNEQDLSVALKKNGIIIKSAPIMIKLMTIFLFILNLYTILL